MAQLIEATGRPYGGRRRTAGSDGLTGTALANDEEPRTVFLGEQGAGRRLLKRERRRREERYAGDGESVDVGGGGSFGGGVVRRARRQFISWVG
jgi:hypothetical protein